MKERGEEWEKIEKERGSHGTREQEKGEQVIPDPERPPIKKAKQIL